MGQSYAIAAQRRQSAKEDGVFSFVNCTVQGNGAVFLGRAWGQYSRVIYSYSQLDIDVKPQGWDDGGKPSRRKYMFFLIFIYIYRSNNNEDVTCHVCTYLFLQYGVVWRVYVQRQGS